MAAGMGAGGILAKRDEELRCRQMEQRYVSAQRKAKIPKRYLDADLRFCKPEVARWAQPGEGCAPKEHLILWGERTGTGKTYAACAVLNALLLKQRCMFAGIDDILEEIRGTFDRGSARTQREVLDQYVSYDVLVVDDLGKEKLTDWSRPVVFRLVNRRYNDMRRTIITSNLDGRSLSRALAGGKDGVGTAEAILSRLGEDSTSVHFDGPDLRRSGR